jgi:hypothetical protein
MCEFRCKLVDAKVKVRHAQEFSHKSQQQTQQIIASSGSTPTHHVFADDRRRRVYTSRVRQTTTTTTTTEYTPATCKRPGTITIKHSPPELGTTKPSRDNSGGNETVRQQTPQRSSRKYRHGNVGFSFLTQCSSGRQPFCWHLCKTRTSRERRRTLEFRIPYTEFMNGDLRSGIIYLMVIQTKEDTSLRRKTPDGNSGKQRRYASTQSSDQLFNVEVNSDIARSLLQRLSQSR